MTNDLQSLYRWLDDSLRREQYKSILHGLHSQAKDCQLQFHDAFMKSGDFVAYEAYLKLERIISDMQSLISETIDENRQHQMEAFLASCMYPSSPLLPVLTTEESTYQMFESISTVKREESPTVKTHLPSPCSPSPLMLPAPIHLESKPSIRSKPSNATWLSRRKRCPKSGVVYCGFCRKGKFGITHLLWELLLCDGCDRQVQKGDYYVFPDHKLVYNT